MDPPRLFVTIIGAVAIAMVIGFFFTGERALNRAVESSSGVQEPESSKNE